MRINMLSCAAVALIAASPVTFARTADFGTGRPIPYEQQIAMQEADLILTQPIAGVENNYWFDYLTDIGEARHELVDAKKDYTNEMREKGYRVGEVRVEE